MSFKKYIVQHLDDELGPWSELEYLAIARETHEAGAQFCLSFISSSLVLPDSLKYSPGFVADNRSVEDMLASDKAKICLLDPLAPTELSPSDGEIFDIFLFGGILGDDPPRDRTSDLRIKGFQGRNLGPVQMTTDTAVRVTRLIIHNKKTLDKIDYIDEPEIYVNKNEKILMPFRYVQDANGQSIMPEGMLQLIKRDSAKGCAELF